jgi:mycobactin lysine-N-oxygenase
MGQQTKRLAIIGAGPKAAAIAAKAEVLNRNPQRTARIDVTIFEKTGVGANWDGHHGYTDGEQQLCTSSSRDLGYPYLSVFAGINSALHDYSWDRYNIEKPPGYTKWVDHGRTRASHRQFSDYLRWAIKKSGATYVQREVLQLIPKQIGSGRDYLNWQVLIAGKHKKHPPATLFDGVIVTGPGPANVVPTVRLGQRRERIFTGDDFWRRRKDVNNLIKKSATKEIVVIGGGGTAAAIIAWLIKNGHQKTRIYVVSNQATIYARVDSAFENKIFSDVSLWDKISPTNRTAFFNRVNRGVVWSSVINVIDTADGIIPMDGRAKSVVTHPRTILEVRVELWDKREIGLGASVVIDATGFDAWWFRRLLDQTLAEKIWKPSWRDELTRKMGGNLEFTKPAWKYPPVHAPMLSSSKGPGYASLMVLGNMSDAVLSAYVPTQPTDNAP